MRRFCVLTPGKDKPSIAVLGIGAIGGFLAALFHKAGCEVIGIARKEAADLLNREGITIESSAFGNFTENPGIKTTLDKPQDIVFIAVKAGGLKESLDRIPLQYVKSAVIVPLMNGLEHMEVLRHQFGSCVIAASIGNIEVRRVSSTRILHTTKSGTVWLGSNEASNREKVLKVRDLIQGIGLQAELCETEAHVLWGKLVRLCALASTTAASGKPIGFVRSDILWRKNLLNALKEAASVAEKQGVKTDIQSHMDKMDSMPYELSTSMARDVASGNRGETDAILGAVIRQANKYGLKCPAIQSMMDIIDSKVNKG